MKFTVWLQNKLSCLNPLQQLPVLPHEDFFHQHRQKHIREDRADQPQVVHRLQMVHIELFAKPGVGNDCLRDNAQRGDRGELPWGAAVNEEDFRGAKAEGF